MQPSFYSLLNGLPRLALGQSRLIAGLALLTCGATLMTGCTSSAPDAGFINTYAGNGNAEFDGDNKAPTETAFNAPAGVDASGGSVLIADTGNNRVRRSFFNFDPNTNTAGDRVETLAGTGVAGFGGDDGNADQAQLSGPRAVIAGPDAVIFIADTGNNRVRRLNAGTISTEVGDGVARFAGDGGDATSASLSAPVSLVFDDNNRLYIADSGNNRVRVSIGGTLTTFAGNGTAAFAGDGGAATSASLSNPQGVAVDEQNNIYIADTGNNRIRRVTPAGLISTVAGGGSGGDGALATQAALNNPTDVRVTRGGQIIISEGAGNKIRRVTAAGVLTTVAGTGAASFGGDLGPATTARLNNPRGLSLDDNDDVYIADSGNNRIRAIGLTGLPGATTRAATDVSNTTATLNGTLVRNDINASAEFQYGLTTAYGTSVPVTVAPGQNDGEGNTQNLSVNITGLLPNQIYHFRFVATNSVGTTLGQDVTFSTGDASPSLVVTTLSDQSSESDNQTTLREAFEFASSDGDDSEITFAPGLAGTITLDRDNNDGDLNVLSPVTLTGPGAQVITVAGGNRSSSIFLVNSNSNFALSGLSLRGLGSARGNDESNDFGIFNRGGTLTVTNCVLDGFNQAIRSSFATTISGSTITGSSADNAAINIRTGSLSLTNSTVSGNAGNGISLLDGPATLLNCTIAGNGQTGLFNPQDVQNVNAIVSPANVNNCLIVGNGTNVDGTIVNNSNITGVTPAVAGLDPAGLKDNGGQTPTIALIAGGTAVNGGNSVAAVGLTTDQRGQGFPRVSGGTVDVGAFELSNNAPTVANIAVSTNEDAALTFTAAQFDAGFSDTDAGNTLQSIRVDTLPANGTLTIAGNAATAPAIIARADIGTLIYTPGANSFGADSFGYSASDGQVFAAAGAQVNITVSSVNDAPSFRVGANQSVSEDAPAQTVTGFAANLSAGPVNENAQTLSFTVTNNNNAIFSAQPQIAPNGVLTFAPAANANGVATVSVVLRDSGDTNNGGNNASAAQTFTITIVPVNDAPIAIGQNVTTAEDTSKSIVLSATDVDSSTLTYRITRAPANGTLSGTAPNLIYAPNANTNGPDSFIFVANDGSADSAPATVSITVTPVNDAPIANDRSEAIARNVAKTFALQATDVDGDTLTYAVLTQPTSGTISGTAPNLTYTPRRGFSGQDSLTFRANDGTLNSNVATVTFVVGADNAAPVAVSQKFQVNEDSARAITLAGADSDGDALTFKVIAPPSSGTLTGTAPNVVYTPNANFNGADFFTFSANDGTVDGNIGTISLEVLAINDVPSFRVGSDQITRENGGAQTVVGFATNLKTGPIDENNQALNFVVTNNNNALFSAQPTIAPNGTLSYTLAAGAAGAARVNVVLKDNGGVAAGGQDTSAAQTFVITVGAAPINLGVSITPKAPFTRDLLTATPVVSDASGVTYNYQWFVNGRSAQNGANPRFNLNTPGQGDKGDTVSVTVTARNARGGIGAASNRVTIRNSAPFGFSGTAQAVSAVQTRIPLRVFANPGGGDSDNDALTYKRVDGPKNGIAIFERAADGSNALVYQSRKGFIGVEVVKFVTVDVEGRSSNVATLSIDVKGAPVVPPTAQNASGKTRSGVQVDVPVEGEDPNGGPVTFKRVGGPKNGVGEFVILAGGTTVLRYTPRANFVGTEEVRFVALNSDGRPSSPATIRIIVDAPSAGNTGALQGGVAPSASGS